MIEQIACAKTLRQAFRYATRKPGAEIIGGNAAPLIRSGELPEQEQTELIENALNRLEFASSLNPNVRRNCYHLKVSLSLYDRELTDEEFSRLGDEFLAGLILSSENQELLEKDELEIKKEINQFINTEIDKYQYSVIRHHDTEHQHIHLVINRINLKTRKPIERDWDRYRAQKVSRYLEKRFQLESGRNSWEIPLEEKRRDKSNEEETEKVYSQRIKSELAATWVENPNINIQGNRYRLRTAKGSINLYRKGKSKAIARLKQNGEITTHSLQEEDLFAIRAIQVTEQLRKQNLKKQKLETNRKGDSR